MLVSGENISGINLGGGGGDITGNHHHDVSPKHHFVLCNVLSNKSIAIALASRQDHKFS